jgi:hypothetical protein
VTEIVSAAGRRRGDWPLRSDHTRVAVVLGSRLTRSRGAASQGRPLWSGAHARPYRSPGPHRPDNTPGRGRPAVLDTSRAGFQLGAGSCRDARGSQRGERVRGNLPSLDGPPGQHATLPACHRVTWPGALVLRSIESIRQVVDREAKSAKHRCSRCGDGFCTAPCDRQNDLLHSGRNGPDTPYAEYACAPPHAGSGVQSLRRSMLGGVDSRRRGADT